MAIDIVVETIENSIYEAIRQKCVDEGYTPDVARFPGSTIAYNAYLAELTAIAVDKGFAIEVFNSSPQEDKGDEKLPRIVLENEGFLPGSYGIEPTLHTVYNPTIEEYESIETPNQVYHLLVSVTIVAKNIQQRRILQSLLHQAIPIKNYLPLLGTTETFFIDFDVSDNFSKANTGISEYKYNYSIPDIWLTDERIINQVVPITTIILNTLIQERLGITTIIGEEPPTPPVADFSANPTSVVEGSSVQFTDLSSNTPTSWAWSFHGQAPFGDGIGTSTEQNPIVGYSFHGTFSVSLTSTNADGTNTETKTGYITINPPPPPDPPDPPGGDEL